MLSHQRPSELRKIYIYISLLYSGWPLTPEHTSRCTRTSRRRPPRHCHPFIPVCLLHGLTSGVCVPVRVIGEVGQLTHLIHPNEQTMEGQGRVEDLVWTEKQLAVRQSRGWRCCLTSCLQMFVSQATKC